MNKFEIPLISHWIFIALVYCGVAMFCAAFTEPIQPMDLIRTHVQERTVGE